MFLKQYNSVTFYNNKPVSGNLYLDASLTGLGWSFFQNILCYVVGAQLRSQPILRWAIAQLRILSWVARWARTY